MPALAQEDPAASSDKRGSDTEITFLAGADYATGEVNDQDYETTSISAGVAASNGRFSLSASIPYVVTSAPEELIVGQGGILATPLFASPTSQTTTVKREGIGDLQVQAGYQLPISDVNAVVSGSVKVPTASREAGLGSGEFDYGISGQLSKRLGSLVPFVHAGYTVIGEPQGYDVRNTLSGSAGSHILVSKASSVTLSYVYEQSATQDLGDRQSVGVSLNTGLSSKFRLGLEGSAGLSDDAPDARVGLRIGLGF
ncbi:transporter [Qipengyuania sp. CAU 1752]